MYSPSVLAFASGEAGGFLQKRVMPNRSKLKGDLEERNVVQFFRDLGFKAERTLESGARSDGSPTYDIDVCFTPDGPAVIGECKIRKDGFKELYKWIGENDFLTIRADRKERLFVLPERFFRELIE